MIGKIHRPYSLGRQNVEIPEITSLRLASDKEEADLELELTPVIEEEITVIQENTHFIYSGEYLLNLNITTIPYLVDQLLPRTGVVALAGSSDTGKSSLLRQLGCAIATGKKDFLGFALTPRHGRAYYVSTEDDLTAMAVLLQRQNVDKLDHSAYRNIGFIFDTENLVQKLDVALSLNPADAVFIDTFTDIYGGELNITNKVRYFINSYSVIAKKHGCLLVFLHHTGKRTEDQAPSKNNLLGSQGFEAKMRLVIELKQDRNILEQRHLCIVKGNYLPADFKGESHVLYFDENMNFRNTGERVPFDRLKADTCENLYEKPEYIEAMKLRRQGLSCRAIADKLHAAGFSIGKSTVAKWIKASSATVYQNTTETSSCEDGSDKIHDCPTVRASLEGLDDGQ